MEDYENLTNDQIRDRLKKFGLPVIPVTDTTRKILIKRLLNASQNGTAKTESKSVGKTRRETVNVPKQMPLEESDSDADAVKVTKSKQTPNRRATIAVAAEKSKPIERKTISNLKKTTIETVNLADDSDNDVIVPDVAIPPRRASRTSRSPSLGKSTIVTTSYKHMIAPLEEQDDIENIHLANENDSEVESIEPVLLKPKEINRRATQLPSLFGGSSGHKEVVSEEIAPDNSVLRHRYTSFEPPSAFSTRIATDDKIPIDNLATPFLSDFTRRLAQLKVEPLAGLNTNFEITKPSTTTTYDYSENKPYRSSYMNRPNTNRDRYERLSQRAGAYEENHWKNVEQKFRWPIFAVVGVFAIVFIYVFLFMN